MAQASPNKMRRFSKPISVHALEEAGKGVVPLIHPKTMIGQRKFTYWSNSRSQNSPENQVPLDLFGLSTDAATMSKWLCRHVLESRQVDGKPYPPKTIYLLLCGLLRNARTNGWMFIKLLGQERHSVETIAPHNGLVF